MSLRIGVETIRTALAEVHPISEETAERLATWTEVLARWSRAQRIVGWRTPEQLLAKGLRDSWLSRAALGEESFGAAVDVGSGAGLPGLLLAADYPEVPFHLVEARRKRAAYLREAARAMGLAQVTVHHGRSEDVRSGVDLPDLLFVSRAFAAPEDALREAAAWNCTRALVSTSSARIEEAQKWPPEGWRSVYGNFRADMAGDHRELLVRIVP
ncbi:MAG: class I SAM-dependent methyltransferase [Deltaproteobacteria bacterium]|nr:class I SAM-dependent methyltransferase [Deltaproteobacteria bacterium]